MEKCGFVEGNDEEIKGGDGKEKTVWFSIGNDGQKLIKNVAGYSPNQKVFGHHVSAPGSVSVEDMTPSQLETNRRKEIKRDIGNPKNSKK